MINFHVLIYMKALLFFRWFLKFTLTKVAKYNIQKVGYKVFLKKGQKNKMFIVIYLFLESIMIILFILKRR